MGVFHRLIYLSLYLILLGVDKHPLLVPHHYLVPGVPCQVYHLTAQLRMPVLREHHRLPAASVYQSAAHRVRVEQYQVPPVPRPVDRRNDIPV